MSRRLPRAWAPTAAVALAAVTGRQATWVRRRYSDVAPVVSAVDVMVHPAGRHPDAGQRDAGPPVRIVTFGDSGMAGVGVEREADALPVQLAQRVANRVHRVIHVASYARSGARTADVLTEQVPLVGLKAHVSVLLVGTNDVTHLTPPGVLARTSEQLLDALVALGWPVVMCSLPEFRAMTALPHPLVDAAAAYATLVRRVQQCAVLGRPAVELVDVRAAVGQAFVRDTATMSADGFHPSSIGYGLIADALAPSVVRAVSCGGGQSVPLHVA